MFRSLNVSTTLPSSKSRGSPTLTLLGGSESTLGNRKRTVPKVIPAIAAAKDAQATATGEVMNRTRKLRRSSPFFGAGAGLAGIVGLGAAGGGAVTAAAGGVVGLGGGTGSGIASDPS